MDKTYLFYDIETTGLNKAFDQVIQFAAIRTDETFREIERFEFFVKLNSDIVPSPKAFITHRTSLTHIQNSLTEFEAIKKIHKIINTPGTISVGYNTMGFDDEFLRFSFFRNLLSPYTHQYANQCSRMDLYPITVMYFLYKNMLLKWPEKNLKLENLNAMNRFVSGIAHNAMVDVLVTLELARALREDKKMWDYTVGFFDKQTDLLRCSKIQNNKTARPPTGLIIDGKFGAEQQYQSAVTPLGTHQVYKNQTLWLRVDKPTLRETHKDNIPTNTWAMHKKLGEPGMLLPMQPRFLRSFLIQQEECIEQNLKWIDNNKTLFEMIAHYHCHYTYPKIVNLDIDAGLYEQGFLAPYDQQMCEEFHNSSPEEKIKLIPQFSNTHLKDRCIRIMGRHYNDYLTSDLRQVYQDYLQTIKTNSEEIADYRGEKKLTPKLALQQIAELKNTALDTQQQSILNELEIYITTQFM